MGGYLPGYRTCAIFVDEKFRRALNSIHISNMLEKAPACGRQMAMTMNWQSFTFTAQVTGDAIALSFVHSSCYLKTVGSFTSFHCADDSAFEISSQGVDEFQGSVKSIIEKMRKRMHLPG